MYFLDDISLPEHKRAPEIESLNDSQETTSSQEFLGGDIFKLLEQPLPQ